MAHPAEQYLDHRPWPIPSRRWTWRQTWHDLLFAHWRVPSESLRLLIPEPLSIDTFEGSAWLGIVPFRMSGIARRPLPLLPWLSAFPELNVRTYVTMGGKPGVWFFSLDAANSVAVWAARRFFHLPYFRARMSLTENSEGISFHSQRKEVSPSVEFNARYHPEGDAFQATPDTLEHFLIERYCMYAAAPDGRLFRGNIHHQPWPLHRAEGELDPTQLVASHGLHVGPEPPLLHFSRKINVMIWPLELVL